MGEVVVLKAKLDIEADKLVSDCWVYARYSDRDLQRAASIEQQVEECRENAAKSGHLIPDVGVFADRGFLGSDTTRPALNHLMDLVRSGKSKVKHLYIFDTSRLARDEGYAIQLRKFFDFHAVQLHFVSNGMISGSSGFNLQHSICGIMDEQYSKTLGQNVKRGQKHQFQQGYAPGGRCYGYTHVVDLDPAFLDSLNTKNRTGVRQVIHEAEAMIVRLIYDLYLRHGYGYNAIAQYLNERGVKSPRKPQKNLIRSWGTSGVRTILSNPRYIGHTTLGKIETLRHPETKKNIHRKRNEGEFLKHFNGDLRIISDEDFNEVQRRRAARQDKAAQRSLGGQGRSKESRTYIWSGLLSCGICGGAISICQPQTYMCVTANRRGGCSNRTKIKRVQLERHLTELLTTSVFAAKSYEQLKKAILTEAASQLQKKKQDMSRLSTSKESAAGELLALNRMLESLADGIARHGYSDTLSKALRTAESQKAMLEELVNGTTETLIEVSENMVDGFLQKGFQGLTQLLLCDPVLTKEEIRTRVNRLVLTPTTFEGSPAYRITGDVRLFSANEPMMLGSNGPVSAKHHDLALNLSGLVLKLDGKGNVQRVASPANTVFLPLAA